MCWQERPLPEDSEDKDGWNKGDEGGGVAGGVHLLEIGEVGRLKNKH